MLWSYPSLDDRIRIRKEAQELEEWVEASKTNYVFFKDRLLVEATFQISL